MSEAITGAEAPDIPHDHWLKMRRDSIGASEAAAACAEDPTVSPMELVCRKRGEIPEADLSGIEAITWGKLLEPAIVSETARRAKLELIDKDGIRKLFARDADTELVGFVEGRQPFLRSRARPWQTATPDAIAFEDATGSMLGIEVKNAGQYHSAAWDVEEGTAPEKYQIQVAHQLAVAPRLSGAILAGLVGGNSLRTLRLERVRIALVIEAVVAIESRVWDCVRSGAMPELSGPPDSIARVLKQLHPDDNGSSMLLPDEFLEIAKRFEAAKKQHSELEAVVKALRSEIAAKIGDASYGVMPDGSGRYSLLTTEKDEYVVGPQKYRQLRFKKTETQKTTRKKKRA